MPRTNKPKDAAKTAAGKRKSLEITEVYDAQSWSDVPPKPLLEMVTSVTEIGGAVMLGRSRSGDMLSIRIYHDDLDAKTLWFRDETGLETIYDAIWRFVNS